MTPSMILDIITIAILLISVISYARKGFVYSVVRLVGTVACWVVCSMYARPVAIYIYANYLQGRVEEAVAKNLHLFVKPGMETFSQSLDSLATELPGFISSLFRLKSGEYMEQWYGYVVSTDGSNSALSGVIVDNMVSPIALSILNTVVFLVLFAVCSFGVDLLCSLVKGVRHIPVVGSLNFILGGCLGVVWGILYIYIISAVLWLMIAASGDTLSFIHTQDIHQSMLFKVIYTSAPWGDRGMLPL